MNTEVNSREKNKKKHLIAWGIVGAAVAVFCIWFFAGGGFIAIFGAMGMPYKPVDSYAELEQMVEKEVQDTKGKAYFPNLSQYDTSFDGGWMSYGYEGNKQLGAGYYFGVTITGAESHSKFIWLNFSCKQAAYMDTENSPFPPLQSDYIYKGVKVQEKLLAVSENYENGQQSYPNIPDGGMAYSIFQTFDFQGCRYEIAGGIAIPNDLNATDAEAYLTEAKEELRLLTKSIIDQG